MSEKPKIPLAWLRRNWRQNTTQTKWINRIYYGSDELMIPSKVGGWDERLVLTWRGDGDE